MWWELALKCRRNREPQTHELLQLNHGPPPSLSLSFSLSLLLARPLIVPRLTGHSQSVMEMSCEGGGGRVAWCGKLVDE